MLLADIRVGMYGRIFLQNPAVVFSHPQLLLNRPKSSIDSRCVWVTSGETINFNENSDSALSGIVRPWDSGVENNQQYPISTVSLADLLLEHNAPVNIGFLSNSIQKEQSGRSSENLISPATR